MKSMKITLLAIAAMASVIMVACNKDQAVVKQLEGDWKVTSQTVDGTAAPDSTYSGITYTFEKCKVKKENCDGKITAPDPTKGTVTTDFTYSITDKGETITFNYSYMGLPLGSEDASIDEHSKNKFVFTMTDSSSTTVTTLEPK